MELDIIKLQTTWNDAASAINSNFAKFLQAITALEAEGGGGLDESELLEFLSKNGYATEGWVLDRGFATIDEVNKRVNAIVDGAPAAYDTLNEIALVLEHNVNNIGDILVAIETKASKDSVKKVEETAQKNASDIVILKEEQAINTASIEALDNRVTSNTSKIETISTWFELSEDGKTLTTKKNLVSERQISSGGVGAEGEGGGGGGSGSTTLAGLLDVELRFDGLTDEEKRHQGLRYDASQQIWRNNTLMVHHPQEQPKEIWYIQHNLGKYPNVKIVDSNKQLCMADIIYPDENNVIIKFGFAESGHAYLD